MHVCFVDILLPRFLANILVNTLIFEVGHLHIHFGTLDVRVRGDCCHLWVGGGIRGIGHYGWLIAIGGG